MRTAALLLILLIPLAQAVQTGYCTGQYVEKGPQWVDGLIQHGDVYEYWCELPTAVPGDTAFDVELRYPNAHFIRAYLMPRVVHGTTLVVFP